MISHIKPNSEHNIPRKIARLTHWLSTVGAIYQGTSDDRLDRWYVQHIDTDYIDGAVVVILIAAGEGD